LCFVPLLLCCRLLVVLWQLSFGAPLVDNLQIDQAIYFSLQCLAASPKGFFPSFQLRFGLFMDAQIAITGVAS